AGNAGGVGHRRDHHARGCHLDGILADTRILCGRDTRKQSGEDDNPDHNLLHSWFLSFQLGRACISQFRVLRAIAHGSTRSRPLAALVTANAIGRKKLACLFNSLVHWPTARLSWIDVAAISPIPRISEIRESFLIRLVVRVDSVSDPVVRKSSESPSR